MYELNLPTPLHASVLAEVVEELKSDDNVLGVLLIGSLARGTARPDSDIDLIVVQANGDRVIDRRSHGQLIVELSFRTPVEWEKQFTPTRVGDESWGYAFLDGVILHDPRGAVAKLIDRAAKAHAAYRVPKDIVDHFVWLWSHLRPKMEAVLQSRDGTEIGWSVAVLMHPVLQTVWAVNNLPLPSLDLGCVQRHLDDLTLPNGAPELIRTMLQEPPESALRLQLQILDSVTPLLQEQVSSQ